MQSTYNGLSLETSPLRFGENKYKSEVTQLWDWQSQYLNSSLLVRFQILNPNPPLAQLPRQGTLVGGQGESQFPIRITGEWSVCEGGYSGESRVFKDGRLSYAAPAILKTVWDKVLKFQYEVIYKPSLTLAFSWGLEPFLPFCSTTKTFPLVCECSPFPV